MKLTSYVSSQPSSLVSSNSPRTTFQSCGMRIRKSLPFRSKILLLKDSHLWVRVSGQAFIDTVPSGLDPLVTDNLSHVLYLLKEGGSRISNTIYSHLSNQKLNTQTHKLSYQVGPCLIINHTLVI